MRIISIIVLCVLTSVVFAERGGFNRGGLQAGNHGDFHGGYPNGFHGNDLHANDTNVYHGYNYQNYGTTGVIVAPGASAACTSQQVCNNVGQCWTQQNCD